MEPEESFYIQDSDLALPFTPRPSQAKIARSSSLTGKIAHALWNYEAQNSDELSLEAHDCIRVHGPAPGNDSANWLDASHVDTPSRGPTRGLVPKAYVSFDAKSVHVEKPRLMSQELSPL